MCSTVPACDVLIERGRDGYLATTVIPDETGDGSYLIITYRKEGQLFTSITWDDGCCDTQDMPVVSGPEVGRVYKDQLEYFHREEVARLKIAVDWRLIR